MKLLPILLAALPLLPLGAHAEEAQRAIHVRYADLDLSTPAGVKSLDRRLAWAISSICSEGVGSVITGQRFADRRCVRAKHAEIAPLRDRVVAAYARPVLMAARAQ